MAGSINKVILVGNLGRDPEVMQGQVEVSEYRVSSKVPGRILELRVKEGDYVKAGDTLAIIDAPEVRAKMEQARKLDDRPLYILVWGCLEDVAQALHDAPDIAHKLRVHWIGGPNKKWGVNAYCYIIEHFPNLWMIENNTTYRGLIYDSKNKDEWNAGFFENHIKDAGHLGRDFAAYYKGNPKLGDTPSLLYLMKGNPSNPAQQSWAGRFVKTNRTPRSIFFGATTAKDTAQICSILEW